jgi:dUTP pyrophosphatase
MKVKFKKLLPGAVTPSYAKPGDAGLDLTATSHHYTEEYIEYSTSIAVEIPEGFVGLLFPRSSVTNKSMMLKNSVGVIDSNYRGEIKLRFATVNTHPHHSHNNYYQVSDRVGQLIIVPIPNIELEEVEELTETNRGADGYGSTGK